MIYRVTYKKKGYWEAKIYIISNDYECYTAGKEFSRGILGKVFFIEGKLLRVRQILSKVLFGGLFYIKTIILCWKGVEIK